MWRRCFSRRVWREPLLALPDRVGVVLLHVRVEVAWPGDSAGGWLAADIVVPERIGTGRVPVLFCFPGGGMTRTYFDLSGPEEFSFARAMADRGMISVLVDHPGTGESFLPPGGFEVTAATMAQVEAVAVADMVARVRDGSLHAALPAVANVVAVGVGHSMGAMMVTAQQTALRPYRALGLLCFSTRGLPDVLTEAELAAASMPDGGRAACPSLAEVRFGVPFVRVSAPRDGSAAAGALSRAAGRMPATVGMQSMLPGNVAAEAAAIDVPVFLAAGDRDLTGPPEDIPASFSGSGDVTLHVLRQTGHHPFVTDASAGLYARFANWVDALG